jgi:hypothetical protein
MSDRIDEAAELSIAIVRLLHGKPISNVLAALSLATANVAIDGTNDPDIIVRRMQLVANAVPELVVVQLTARASENDEKAKIDLNNLEPAGRA